MQYFPLCNFVSSVVERQVLFWEFYFPNVETVIIFIRDFFKATMPKTSKIVKYQ